MIALVAAVLIIAGLWIGDRREAKRQEELTRFLASVSRQGPSYVLEVPAGDDIAEVLALLARAWSLGADACRHLPKRSKDDEMGRIQSENLLAGIQQAQDAITAVGSTRRSWYNERYGRKEHDVARA